MAPAGEFTKGLWSGKLEFFIANFKLKDVSTYHAGARYQPNLFCLFFCWMFVFVLSEYLGWFFSPENWTFCNLFSELKFCDFPALKCWKQSTRHKCDNPGKWGKLPLTTDYARFFCRNFAPKFIAPSPQISCKGKSTNPWEDWLWPRNFWWLLYQTVFQKCMNVH